MEKNINIPVEIIGRSNAESSRLSSIEDVEILVINTIRKNIRQWIERCEVNRVEPTTGCRECGMVANFTSKRIGSVQTKFGLIYYFRAHYLCPHCQHPTYPLDERLNPVESLARMRTKILAGTNLPVGALAKAWGLGSLKISADQIDESLPEGPPASSEFVTKIFEENQNQLMPFPCHPIYDSLIQEKYTRDYDCGSRSDLI